MDRDGIVRWLLTVLDKRESLKYRQSHEEISTAPCDRILVLGSIAHVTKIMNIHTISDSMKMVLVISCLVFLMVWIAVMGWQVGYPGTNNGFLKQEPGGPAHEVGASSICGRLGHYSLPFRTDVMAYWGFDTNGYLIDVWVRKDTDAL
jgi:hypothetical protein